jgi:hypothetical protein
MPPDRDHSRNPPTKRIKLEGMRLIKTIELHSLVQHFT